MVVISIGIIIGKIGSVYCGNSEIDYISKELGRIITRASRYTQYSIARSVIDGLQATKLIR